MKRIAAILVMLLGARLAAAQSGYTQVTLQVPCYGGGTVNARWVNGSTSPQLPTLNGSVFNQTFQTGMDSGGNTSFRLADVNQITPLPSTWTVTACAKGGANPPCYTATNLTITGSSQNISSAFTGAACSVTPAQYIVGTTIAKLPLASISINNFYSIYDGTSTTDCTTGGGSTPVICESNGSTWRAVSGISGMTAGQVPIAASSSTITSSKPIQGTDGSLLSSGTVSGTGAALCTDANGGATTSGCTSDEKTVVKNIPLAVVQNGNAQPAGCTVFSNNPPLYVDVGDGSDTNVAGAASLVPAAGSAQVMSCPLAVPSNFGGTLSVAFNLSDTVASDSVVMYAKAVCTYTPANPSFGTAVSVTPTISGTPGTVVTTTGITVTPGGTCTAGEPMYLQVYRSTSDSGTGNVYLYNVQVQYSGSL